MVSKAQGLLSLYEEMGVKKDKLIFRVPATWAGIQAAAALEKEGIATQAFHIYRCARITLRPFLLLYSSTSADQRMHLSFRAASFAKRVSPLQ